MQWLWAALSRWFRPRGAQRSEGVTPGENMFLFVGLVLLVAIIGLALFGYFTGRWMEEPPQ